MMATAVCLGEFCPKRLLSLESLLVPGEIKVRQPRQQLHPAVPYQLKQSQVNASKFELSCAAKTFPEHVGAVTQMPTQAEQQDLQQHCAKAQQ